MERKVIILLLTGLFILQSFSVFSQTVNVTDDETYNPESSAMLDVYSTDKGMLVPRMTTLQRTSVSTPADGLLVYDINFNAFYYSVGEEWVRLSSMIDSSSTGDPLFHIENSSGDTVFAVYE